MIIILGTEEENPYSNTIIIIIIFKFDTFSKCHQNNINVYPSLNSITSDILA